MNGRLAGVIRIVQRLLSWLAALIVLSLLATTCALYLAVSGKSLPLLRALATQLGSLMAGQRTESVTLDVEVMPTQGRIAGTATLTLRSLDANRQRFYFLLNDGLRVREVRAGSPGSESRPAVAYQLQLLTVVDVGAPVAKDGTVQLTFRYDGAPASGAFSIGSNVLDPRQVLLNVDAFWYPSDVQGFFTADVTVTAPLEMTVVHNATHAQRAQRGDLQRVHWTTERPIAGLALVAGTYDLTTMKAGDTAYRLYLPPDVHLDPDLVLGLMRDAASTLDERYGPSGFPQITLFVTRDLRRGFNDGSGLMGLSIRYFRAGDYGFGIIAHEIAHNWWGSTVAEKWLSPGTGGEWLVEGFAEFSSLIAIEAKYGAAGLTRRLASEFFDPERQAAVADMSVLDNVLAEATARDTIYRKGAYVAIMLRAMLGEEAYFSTLRQFLERFRYQQATEADLQQMLQQLNGEDMDRYFSDWVRSDRLADLSLDEAGPGAITVSNLGAATIAGPIDLWTFKKDGGEPIRATVKVGDTVTLAADGDSWVLDPLLAWADMERENNRYPRRHDPVYAAAAPGGTVALTRGGTLPWVRTTVSATASGSTKQTWDFERGMAEPPAWSADAARLIVSASEAAEPLPAIVTLATDGGRRLLGHGSAPAAAPDGTIYAGKHDRIVRLGSDGRETEVVQRRGEVLDMPLPSPDGTRLVYTAARGNHVELRAVRPDGRGDHLLLSWDRDWMLYRWSTEGTRLYAVAGGDWDWQIWEIPLGAGAVRVLAAGAAAIGDLALSPDGRQLAFTAAPSLDYPINRRQLYVLDPANRAVRNVDVPGTDLSQVTWLDGEVVLVVATTVDPGHPWVLPAQRSLKRVSVANGGIEDAP